MRLGSAPYLGLLLSGVLLTFTWTLLASDAPRSPHGRKDSLGPGEGRTLGFYIRVICSFYCSPHIGSMSFRFATNLDWSSREASRNRPLRLSPQSLVHLSSNYKLRFDLPKGPSMPREGIHQKQQKKQETSIPFRNLHPLCVGILEPWALSHV